MEIIDPIFNEIAAHQEAARTLDAALAERERLHTPGNFPELDPGLADAELYAAATVITTAPTTLEGLQALKAHLANDRSSLCWAAIRNQMIDDGHTFEPSSDPFRIPVAMFAEKRAAELG